MRVVWGHQQNKSSSSYNISRAYYKDKYLLRERGICSVDFGMVLEIFPSGYLLSSLKWFLLQTNEYFSPDLKMVRRYF